MSRRANVPLSSLLTPWQHPHPVKPHVSYPIAGVFGFGRGMISRPAVLGSEISATQLFQIKSGQLIYSKLKAFEGAFAITAEPDHGRFVSSEFPTFDIDTTRVHSSYIAWYFRRPSFWRDIRGQSTGTVNRRERLHPDQLLRHEVALPPLDEQRRIVDLLERAAGIRRLREQALAKARAIVPALFLDMFGDPASNPKRWPVTRLGSVATRMSDGPFGSNLKTEHYAQEGIRVWRLQNIGVGFPIEKDRAHISEAHFARLKKHECLPGDVIIGTLGEPNLRAFIQPGTIPLALNKADCVQFRPNPGVCHAEFICWLLNMPGTLRLAQSQITGQTRARLSMGRLREVHVPVPPLDEQHRFAERVIDLRSIIAQQERSLAAARELERSLMARLLG